MYLFQNIQLGLLNMFEQKVYEGGLRTNLIFRNNLDSKPTKVTSESLSGYYKSQKSLYK